ncbi:Bbp19 family protein [Acinetobacter pollinis]|uniref:Bbp19-like phage domain-containing protein n=1 Tax=Acinetobacter pollinis TaxID=2605270 RepID=A0ABU6DWL2_9GAMM|nr:hypothetical protein [Acinetobacter pollinis]MEB5477277.1 hypothetical protein [Acinetobacter pollinis]
MIYVLIALNLILLLFLVAITYHRLQELKKAQAVQSSKQQPIDDIEKPSKEIRQRYPRKPTPQDYYTLFEVHPIGQDVLDDLISIFGGSSYVRGGQDADRETCFRAGRKHVVDHILIQINKANKPNLDHSEVETDD